MAVLAQIDPSHANDYMRTEAYKGEIKNIEKSLKPTMGAQGHPVIASEQLATS